MQDTPASIGSSALRVLALGTSTDWCSVGLLVRNDGRNRERGTHERAGQAQSAKLLPMAMALVRDAGLALADIDVIAFDAGPGAFTGLRIGCSVAQGLGFALERPLVPVMSLEALALQSGAAHVLVAIDARMSEVYCAAFRCAAGDVLATDAVKVLGVPDAQRQLLAWSESLGGAAGCVAIGDAFERHPVLADALGAHGVRVMHAQFPGGEAIARIAAVRFDAGRALAARDAAPVYVRDKVALNVDEQRALRAAKARA